MAANAAILARVLRGDRRVSEGNASKKAAAVIAREALAGAKRRGLVIGPAHEVPWPAYKAGPLGPIGCPRPARATAAARNDTQGA